MILTLNVSPLGNVTKNTAESFLGFEFPIETLK
jgi:hypothetical protein